MAQCSGDLADDEERGETDVSPWQVEIVVEDEDEKRYVPLWLFSTVVTIAAVALAFVTAALLTLLGQH